MKIELNKQYTIAGTILFMLINEDNGEERAKLVEIQLSREQNQEDDSPK